MREILFRGKAVNRIDGRQYRTKYKNGDWVYGLLTNIENYAGISEMTNTDGVSGIDVDPSTVGQYTGVRDDNDERVFEGDVLQFSYTGKNRGVEGKAVVVFENGKFGVKWGWHKEFVPLDGFANTKIEVIGNIHDTPELLEVEHESTV